MGWSLLAANNHVEIGNRTGLELFKHTIKFAQSMGFFLFIKRCR